MDRSTSAGGQDTVAIIVAAGSSERMGGTDKLWAEVDGAPVVAHAFRPFLQLPDLSAMVIVAPAERHDAIRALTADATARITCVEGGTRRQDSVARGLAAEPEAGWYLVHDGARPLVSVELIQRVLDVARQHGAAIPGVPLVEAVKRIDLRGRVLVSLDRAGLRAAQTPQAFAGALLRRAHATSHATVADDATMVEAIGSPVHVVEGDPENLKITTAIDLELAELLLGRRQSAQPAAGRPRATERSA